MWIHKDSEFFDSFAILSHILSDSSVGAEEFLPWNWKVPPLELKSSSLGTKKFQEWNKFWNSYVT